MHASVLERIRNATDGYAPVNLPREFEIADTGSTRLPWWEHVGATVRARENGWRAFDIAWDVIWLRRLQYFALVGLTIFLAFKLTALGSRAASGPAVPWGIAGAFFDAAAWAAPAALEGWVEALRDNPFWLLLFTTIAAVMLVFRARLLLRASEAGTAAWRHFYGLDANLPMQNPLEKGVRWIRGSALAHGSSWFARTAVPWLVLAALGAGLIGAGWWLAQPPDPPPAPSTACGRGCVPLPLAVGEARVTRFEPGCPVQATTALLEAGALYSIAVEVEDEWCDASYSASPSGLRERAEDSECREGAGELTSPTAARVFRWGRPFKRERGARLVRAAGGDRRRQRASLRDRRRAARLPGHRHRSARYVRERRRLLPLPLRPVGALRQQRGSRHGDRDPATRGSRPRDGGREVVLRRSPAGYSSTWMFLCRHISLRICGQTVTLTSPRWAFLRSDM